MQRLLYPSFWKTRDEAGLSFIAAPMSFEDLNFTTQLHGGFGSCTFRIQATEEELYLNYRNMLNAHMVLFDGWGRRAYEGRIIDASLGNRDLDIQAEGYYGAANDTYQGLMYFYDSGNPVTVTDVINDCIDLIEGSGDLKLWRDKIIYLLQDANVDITLLGDKDYRQVKIKEVLEENLKLGYKETDGTPIYFAIWEDRIPHFFKQPDISLTTNLKDHQLWIAKRHNLVDEYTLSRSRNDVYNKIWGVYEGEEGFVFTDTAAENKISQGIFNTREGLINVGRTYEGNAEALRDAALGYHDYPRQSFSLTLTGLVEHLSGMKDYPFRIRAGDIILLSQFDPYICNLDNPFSESVGGVMGMIMSTSYNGDNNTVRVDVNSKDTRFDTLLARLGISGGIA